MIIHTKHLKVPIFGIEYNSEPVKPVEDISQTSEVYNNKQPSQEYKEDRKEEKPRIARVNFKTGPDGLDLLI